MNESLYIFFVLEKQLLLACSRDDTLKLIELRENRVIQTFKFVDLTEYC